MTNNRFIPYAITQAWQSLRHKPGFIFGVVVTMGITLGALLCVLTLGYVILFKPLPYPEQNALYNVRQVATTDKGQQIGFSFSYPGLIDFYRSQKAFSETVLTYYDKGILVNHAKQPTVSMTYVTPEWVSFFAPPMALGRNFEQSEKLNTNSRVVVISYSSWQQLYNADPEIIGKTVAFRDHRYKVIGVTAKDFLEAQLYQNGWQTQFWLPWDFNPVRQEQRQLWQSGIDGVRVVGKQVKAPPTNAEISALSVATNLTWQQNTADQEHLRGWKIAVDIQALNSAIVGKRNYALYFLLAGIFGLVLIAFANVINLFISRTAEQQHQLAITAAVGAKKFHIFNIIFVEAGLLMSAAILLSLLISYGGINVLQRYLSEYFPRLHELAISNVTLLMAVSLVLIFAALFAYISSKTINYSKLNTALQRSGKGAGVQVSKRIRQMLIVSQVAIAATLVFINISLFNESYRVISKPLSINTQDLIDLSLSVTRPPTQAEIDGPVLGTAVKNQLLLLPQVASVSTTLSPLSGFYSSSLTVLDTNEHLGAELKWVDVAYFELIGQKLIAGKSFTHDDIDGREVDENDDVEEHKNGGRVFNVIVNDVFAKQLNASESVIGKVLKARDDFHYQIIGVVQGVQLPNENTIPARAYFPNSVHSISMLIKLLPNQVLSREEVVTSINQATSLFSIFSMDQVSVLHDRLLFTQYLTAITSAALATLSFFLAGIGLYGILNYSTQMRRFEIGTRMAIGAKGRDIIALVIKDNLLAVLFGIVLSTWILLGLYMGFADRFSYAINLQTLIAFAMTLLLIFVLAFFACYLPLKQFIQKPAMHSLRVSD